MSERFVSVQVSEDSRADLAQLSDELGGDMMMPISAHPFDGVAFIQIVFPLTALSAVVLRTWIEKKAESRKSMRVIVDGIDITGYTSAEAQKILDKLINQDSKEPISGEEKPE
ncbi:MAG: hypothetical protein ACRDTG_12650 [Pseudonocardiaceae bacterium]